MTYNDKELFFVMKNKENIGKTCLALFFLLVLKDRGEPKKPTDALDVFPLVSKKQGGDPKKPTDPLVVFPFSFFLKTERVP